MFRAKYFMGWMLVLMLVVAPDLSVGAAAPSQTVTLDGTIQSCVTAINSSNGDAIVVCEINLTGGGTKTIRLSVNDAVMHGLAVLNEDGSVTIIAAEGQDVHVDETLILADPCVMPENSSQPISKLLANYFCGDLGLSYDDFQSLHEGGFGFGEIAQACFMALKLEGTGQLCSDILYAKTTGDYSKLTLPDGGTVSNWGQLRKAIIGKDKKDSSLGSVVSDTAKSNSNKDKNKDTGKDKNKGNGNNNTEHGKPTK